MPPPTTRSNNVGLIRMILALLVILAHSPELTDGNRSREILTQLFGTLSLGEVAVDGFFLLSGFLITGSYQRSKSIWSYAEKRVLRIYPGFVVAFLISLVVVAPLAGALPLPWHGILQQLTAMISLGEPRRLGAFSDVAYPNLNGSLWTIGYEMRCYGLVVLAAAAGLLHRRWWHLGVVMAGAALWLADIHFAPHILWQITGNLNVLLRFGVLFGAGSLFHLFHAQIRYTAARLIAATLILCTTMFAARLAELGIATAGGYLLFWFAFQCPVTPYSRFGDRVDLSYGTYLYAWPIQNLIIHWHHGISPWAVDGLAIPITLLAACASWFAVEKPGLHIRRFIVYYQTNKKAVLF